MRIAVTGATGHLGRRMVNAVVRDGHTVIPIGHTWDDHLDADVLLHLAAPDYRDEDAVRGFSLLNERIEAWSHICGSPVINTGTWWQYAGAEAKALAYTRMKADQQAMFATTLILFSVYGDTARTGRGFIPQLLDHCRGDSTLTGASRQPRDWIHVDDVVAAYMAALGAGAGVYEVNTRIAWSPAELVALMTEETLPDYAEHPSCTPDYRYPWVPGWKPTTRVTTFLRATVAA